jgi:hypothetical protein
VIIFYMYATVRPRFVDTILGLVGGVCGRWATLVSVTALGAGNLSGAPEPSVENSPFP